MPELKKILYVEDDVDIQNIVRAVLGMIGGFEILICSSGQEALEKAPEFSPQLCLLDVMMPEMDGPETFAALRKIESFSAVPFVFLTAKAQPDEIDRLKTLGAVDVLIKPFNPAMLSDQIREIWDNCQAL